MIFFKKNREELPLGLNIKNDPLSYYKRKIYLIHETFGIIIFWNDFLILFPIFSGALIYIYLILFLTKVNVFFPNSFILQTTFINLSINKINIYYFLSIPFVFMITTYLFSFLFFNKNKKLAYTLSYFSFLTILMYLFLVIRIYVLVKV